MQARNQKFFKTGVVSWNYSTSINISSKTHEENVPQGKIFGFFSLTGFIILVNSGLPNFVDVQRLHCFSLNLAGLCFSKRYCCSTFFNSNVSLIEELIHLRFSLVQQFLSRLPRIRLRRYLLICAGKSIYKKNLATRKIMLT